MDTAGHRRRETHLESVSRSQLVRPLVAEALGAFALTSVDAGGAMIEQIVPFATTASARSGAAGLAVTCFAYATAEVSGAHFNPAVTFAFAARRVFPWRRVPFYMLAQLFGATLAALLLRALLGDVARVGATVPGAGGALIAGVAEVLLTFFLVTVILGTAHRHKMIGPHAALAAGGTVALCGLAFRPLSGASMNPARSFGSALVGGALDSYVVYLVGPLIGSAVAVLVMGVLHPTPRGWEAEAARGDG